MRKLSPLSCAVFLLAGCLNESNIAGELQEHNTTISRSEACAIPADAFKTLPTDVLSGTDVVTFDTFQRKQNSSKHFHTDTGGAQIELFLEADGSKFEATRTYREPGLENTATRYTNLCIEAGHIYGNTVRGMFTENGILWLELQSNNEFIAPDLWLYMEKID